MNLFKSIFGNSENQNQNSSNVNWKALTDIRQLDEIANDSAERPVVIFKHSTRCNISRMALKQFEAEFDLNEKMDAYFLDLLDHRAVSNEIADRFNVMHQSPQLLVIKGGKSIYDVSHNQIDAESLKQFITE